MHFSTPLERESTWERKLRKDVQRRRFCIVPLDSSQWREPKHSAPLLRTRLARIQRIAFFVSLPAQMIGQAGVAFFLAEMSDFYLTWLI